MHLTNQLQQQFADNPSIHIANWGDDYPIIQVDNPLATASISLHGAHVLSFQPKGQDPVLWLSEKAIYQPGKAIRGGIPICWPWFGDHDSQKDFPAHGFARTQFFQLEAIEQTPSGTQLKFSLSNTEYSQTLWPHAFLLEVLINVGKSLSTRITMTNLSQQHCRFSSALHSYFQIGDITQISIEGLANTSYFDKLSGFETKLQKGDLRFSEAVDRIYTPSSQKLRINDPVLNRQIVIEKTGSNSTVVWNPWQASAAKMKDMQAEAYQHMVCVETANAKGDEILLKPDESHTVGATYSVLS